MLAPHHPQNRSSPSAAKANKSKRVTPQGLRTLRTLPPSSPPSIPLLLGLVLATFSGEVGAVSVVRRSSSDGPEVWARSPVPEGTWDSEMRGGELHIDLRRILAGTSGLNMSDNFSSTAWQVLQAARPHPPSSCGCTLDRWDQYATCWGAYYKVAGAWSFGINSYDPWAHHVSHRALKIPDLFDCFETREPNFWNRFHPTCLGAKEEMREGRPFQTLPNLLKGVPADSALVKMDIEKSEWEVLENLPDEDFQKLRSLHVEYHFNYHCPTDEELLRAQRVMSRVREQMLIVDAAAAFYDTSCMVGGMSFPKVLAVSYVSQSACWPASETTTFVLGTFLGFWATAALLLLAVMAHSPTRARWLSLLKVALKKHV